MKMQSSIVSGFLKYVRDIFVGLESLILFDCFSKPMHLKFMLKFFAQLCFFFICFSDYLVYTQVSKPFK